MAGILRDSAAAVVVRRTRPRAIPLAMLAMITGIRLAARRAVGAPLLNSLKLNKRQNNDLPNEQRVNEIPAEQKDG